MNDLQAIQLHTVERPDRAVRQEFVEPILTLAARMSHKRPVPVGPEKPMIELLAELTGHRGFQEAAGNTRLTEKEACRRLSTTRSRKAALVVLSLVLKTDSNRGAPAQAYFTWLRQQLGLSSIVVPAGVDDHLRLALEYLRD